MTRGRTQDGPVPHEGNSRMVTKSRRTFIRESTGVLSAGLMGSERPRASGRNASSGRRKPNVLLILTDQQRIDTLGYRGLSACRTPNVDRLAREGISFDRCLTPSPICTPARSALFTGLYPHQIGMCQTTTA
jgi:hypothetical protein